MGIAVNTYPPIVKPRERISQVTIPGRQGDLAIPESNGEPIYEAYLRTVECTLLPDAQLQNVLSWLTGTGSVIFGNEPGMVYTARIVNQISFDKIMRGREHRSFSVPFYCQPLKAAAETEEPVALTASGLSGFFMYAGSIPFRFIEVIESKIRRYERDKKETKCHFPMTINSSDNVRMRRYCFHHPLTKGY